MWPRPRRADDARMRASPASSPSTTRPPQRAESRPATVLTRVGGWCFDHPWRAIALWLAAVVTVFGAAGAVGPGFSATSDVPDSDSADGMAVLQAHFPELGTGGRSGTIVFRADQGVDDPEVRRAMEDLFAVVDAGFPDAAGDAEHPGATVVSPYSPQGAGQIAADGPLAGQVAYAQVNLAADVEDTASGRIGEAIAERAPAIDGLEVYPGGQYLTVADPPASELIGVAFAVVVLIVAFGSVLAMGLPIAVALGGVGAGVGGIVLLSNAVAIPEESTILALMIGLGVGIDYALFVITRYREGLHAGRSPRDATLAAMDSAGRAVVFAGTTVVVSMLGLLLVGIGWIGGVGVAVSATVLATMTASVTLLPALLGLVRGRVEVTRWRGLVAAGCGSVALLGAGLGVPALAAAGAVLAVLTLLASLAARPLRRTVPHRTPVPAGQTLAHRWSRTIQRRPWAWLATATVVLLVLASPVLDLRLGWPDEGNFPEGTDVRQAYDLLADAFGPGFNGPFVITAVPGVGGAAAGGEDVATLAGALADTPGVASVTPPMPDDPAAPAAWVMTLVPTTAPQDEATTALARELRADVIPAATAGSGLEVDVTGLTATNVDTTDYLADRMLLFFAAVLALSFVLLAAVFRSLLVPLKAVVMNVASIAAAYGVVVAVFQWGWGSRLLGLEGGPINPYVPMMLFAVVFGLSMDYEVFLLSRIREEYARTGDARGSVADGLAATARVITAAAAIMVAVFASFLLEDLRDIKVFGLGLAVAVLLDATLVRMLLVPATMELLGDRNWWIPRWLDRRLPRLHVEARPTATDIALAPRTKYPYRDESDRTKYDKPLASSTHS
jgi:RND superfamily putative drug exporter